LNLQGSRKEEEEEEEEVGIRINHVVF